MVEGHGVHRVAESHKKRLRGHKFVATSPNGRFVAGAEAINNKTLERIEAHGKNLFYFFGGSSAMDAGVVVCHIHFGMAGQFKTTSLPGPEPTKTTRLQLVNEAAGIVVHLSAMTLDHGDFSHYTSKRRKLGEDVVRRCEGRDPTFQHVLGPGGIRCGAQRQHQQ